MSKKKYYGVLMNRINIHEDIYLFQPNYIISGKIEKDVFVDDMNNRYFFSDSIESLRCEDTSLVISSIISEEELKQTYPSLSLIEAKSAYLATLKDFIHIGFYLLVEERIILRSYNVDEIFNKVRTRIEDTEEYDIEGKSELASNTTRERFSSDYIEEECINMSVKDFKRILEISDDKKLRDILSDLYRQYQNGSASLSLEFCGQDNLMLGENLTKEKIVIFFNKLFEKILLSEKLNEILDLGNVMEQNFTKLILMLDVRGSNEIPLNAAEEILYRLIDEISMIMSTKNLNQIKKDISRMRKEEAKNIEQVATIYEDYDKKFNAQMDDVFLPDEIPTSTIIDAKAMKRFFDKRIAGQEQAKRDVISAIVMNSLSEDSNDRVSCFLVGPPGSGKTLIAQTASEFLDIPFEIVDTTQLTSPGYVGGDIEDALARLLIKADGDLKKAESGIVVFDELDKKGSEKKSDIAGKAVLNTLLSFIQGTNYSVKSGREKVTFNTSKLTIFATGACADVAKAKLHKEGLNPYRKTRIGFASELDSVPEEDFEYPKLEREDFVKYGGMTDEIIGRITTICQLSGHTKESLKFILTEIENSALVLLKNKLSKIGVKLTWTEEYLDAVVSRALKLKTGARSLKSTVEESVAAARWEALLNPSKYSEIILTGECVENPASSILVDNMGNKFFVSELSNEIKTSEKIKKIEGKI